jgi:hypothetical protein
MIFGKDVPAEGRARLLVAQHSFGFKQGTHGFGCMSDRCRISSCLLERGRRVLPIDVRHTFADELSTDESCCVPNSLQLYAHPVPIVGYDLKRQWRGVVQHGEFHGVIIGLKAPRVEYSEQRVQRNENASIVGQRCAALAPLFSGPEASGHMRSLARSIIITSALRFSVHTADGGT